MQKVLIFTLFSLSVFAQKTPVDFIVHHAVIYTADKDFNKKEAFAIKDGKFLALGTNVQIQGKFQAKQQFDAKNAVIFPGFLDPHSHFVGLGQMLSQCDLVGSSSYQEIIERLKVFAKNNPQNTWIIGRGWDQNDWQNKQFPDKMLLDEAFPNIPVLLTRIDGHAVLINQKAINLAKISNNSKIDGGDVELKNGKLTGILIDNAMGLVRYVLPRADETQKRKMILAAQQECFKYGLTSVSDAGLNQDDIDLIDKMNKERILKIRNYVMVSIGIQNLENFVKKGIYKTDQLNVRSFKLYADGALGSRGACLLQPYSDEPSKTGFLLMSEKELERNLTAIAASDFQANTHCIGDSANRLVLDIYAKLLKGKNNRRWRIEHCQIVSEKDVPKFGAFSIIPSIQSTHATSDMYWAKERLGNQRIKTAYTYQDLLKQNGLVANGSDFPVEQVNPLLGFYSAVTRQDAASFPENGFQIENALSREQALKAMTIWAAYANFEEQEKGSIEVGKMADFVVLNQDLMTVPQQKLRSTFVQQTFVGGERVYKK